MGESTPCPRVLVARPGYFGRLSYAGSRQRLKVGSWLDMSNPVAAWQEVLDVQHRHPERALRLDVLREKDWKVRPVQTLEIKDYINGLAGIEPAPDTTHPVPMEPQSYSQAPAVQVMRPTPTAQEPPANMDHYGQYLFRQQEARLLDERTKVWELNERVRGLESEKQKIKEQLDKAELDLRHKDREKELDIKEMERRVRGEFESREPKPSGLAGLSEALTNPTSPLAGLLGMFASKMLGGDMGAPAAAGGPQLGAYSQNMTDILKGIAELIPDDGFGTKLYTSLAVILRHPDGLKQLQIMAGLAPVQDYATT